MSFVAKIYKDLKGDKVIWMIVAILTVFSVLSVYSASGSLAYQYRSGNTEFYLFKQAVVLMLGLGLTYICYKLNYLNYSRLAPLLLLISIPLLMYTLFFGDAVNEARRWIQVPIIGLTFQTSDFAKLALIIYVARAISNKQNVIKDLNSALFIIIPIVIVCGLIAPADLSTSLLLFTTCLIMMFIGRVKIKYILFLVMLGLLMLALIIIVGTFLPDFVRLDTWITRLGEFMGNSEGQYQNIQAKIAIADGSWFGVGPGNSIQRNYLPYAYADFIYAVICEEYGLVGGFVIIALYLWLFFRCTAIVTKCPKAFGAILAMGLCLNIVIQAFANIAVSVHLVPVTGLTLPLVSMGGSSILVTCISFGIILSVSKYIEYASTQKLDYNEIDNMNESNY